MTTTARHIDRSSKQGNPVRISFPVNVTLAEGAPAETRLNATIAAWVFAPDQTGAEKTSGLWLLGIPGATYRGLAYFDRQVTGYPAQEFSIARYLASQGIGLVVIDTLSTGESGVEVNGELITRFVTAKANAQVLDQLRERLTAGMLVPGLETVPEDALFLGAYGHSMGAFQLTQLAALLEDRGTPLDAAIFAGWSHEPFDYARLQLDANAVFGAMVATNGYYAVPRALMRPMFYGPNPTVPAALIEEDERDAIPFPKGLMDEGVVPGIVAREAGTLSCPVLYVAAAHDVCSNAQAEGGVFHCTRLFTAYTQPDAAHCNFEESRREYWCMVAGWIRMVAALRHQVEPVPPTSVYP